MRGASHVPGAERQKDVCGAGDREDRSKIAEKCFHRVFLSLVVMHWRMGCAPREARHRCVNQPIHHGCLSGNDMRTGMRMNSAAGVLV